MVEITVQYAGDLRCTATHVPAAPRCKTDAPVDNMGKGESFSPTDLVATALAPASHHSGHHFPSATPSPLPARTSPFTKAHDRPATPAHRPPRRNRNHPQKLTDEQKQRLINAADACPVRRASTPNPDPIQWNWG